MIMGQQPDWGKLYVQGRCRAYGVAWTPEEKELIMKSEHRSEVIERLRAEGGTTSSIDEDAKKNLKKMAEKEQKEEEIKELEEKTKEVELPKEERVVEKKIVDLYSLDISQLRAVYQEEKQKRAFPGWNKEQIIERLV